jgi:hypothetical protein
MFLENWYRGIQSSTTIYIEVNKTRLQILSIQLSGLSTVTCRDLYVKCVRYVGSHIHNTGKFPFYLHRFLCSFLFHAYFLYISIFAYTTHNLYGSTNSQPRHPMVLSQCIYAVHFNSVILQFCTFNFIPFNDMTYFNLILT